MEGLGPRNDSSRRYRGSPKPRHVLHKPMPVPASTNVEFNTEGRKVATQPHSNLAATLAWMNLNGVNKQTEHSNSSQRRRAGKGQDLHRKIETLRIFCSQPNRISPKFGPANCASSPGGGFRAC